MSIGTPDSRMTLPITDPRVSRCQRERRVAPMTSWVTFSERAASSSASPMSAPTTSWYVAAELAHELALLREQLRRGSRQAVLGNDVDGDEVAFRPLGDPRGPPNQPLAVGGSGERDHDALAGLPLLGDPVPPAVLLEPLVDPVREPGERQLSERGEVAGPEVVRERRVDPLGRVHVAAGQSVAKGDRASGRRAAARRPGARPRPGSSRAV